MNNRSAYITEIFSSIQGEGIFVGAKQIFVRFRDCNLTCGYCDEPRRSMGKKYNPGSLMRAVQNICEKRGEHHSVSLTGGEPLCQAEFLKAFLKLLRRSGIKTYLETNGTLPEELEKVIDLLDIVAMDFKLPSSTGGRAFWDEHKKFLKIASRKKVFVKAIVTAGTIPADVKKAISIIKGFRGRIPFILQPVTPLKKTGKSVNNKRLLEFMEIGIANKLDDIRVIPQMHKIMGIK